MDDLAPAPAPHEPFTPPRTTPAVPRATLAQLALQGMRAALMLRVRWDRVNATPALLAFLCLFDLAALAGVERLFYQRGAVFNWEATLQGWTGLLLVIWACYVMRERPLDAGPPERARNAADMVAVYFLIDLFLSLLLGITMLLRFDPASLPPLWAQAFYLLPYAWLTIAVLVMLIRAGSRDIGRRVQAVYALAATVVVTLFAPQVTFWNDAVAAAPRASAARDAQAAPGDQADDSAASEEEGPAPIRFSQEVIERQGPLLAQKLAALAPQRRGVQDMYSITFAPYEGEEVFRRESRMVSEVMARRFDAGGRQLLLLNHAEEVDRSVWATPINLRRAIAGVARKMDLAEDVLMIHLTSHGAADGELAANFWPLDVAPVMPANLKQWLDESGIRYRVLSISACFSGSWIAPLATDSTLVMTAADADHTSYGCGKKSDLTFYGRAMFDEQLRTETLSFTQAHAAARKIIDKREKEAGKDDGYSNPQIKVGKDIVPYLERLTTRLSGK